MKTTIPLLVKERVAPSLDHQGLRVPREDPMTMTTMTRPLEMTTTIVMMTTMMIPTHLLVQSPLKVVPLAPSLRREDLLVPNLPRAIATTRTTIMMTTTTTILTMVRNLRLSHNCPAFFPAQYA